MRLKVGGSDIIEHKKWVGSVPLVLNGGDANGTHAQHHSTTSIAFTTQTIICSIRLLNTGTGWITTG